MQCKEALQAILDAQYEGREPPAEAVEALKREDCRALLERSRKLDALLALNDAHEPGPGFDTRFFAKLEEHKQGKRHPFLPALFGTLTVGAATAAVLAVTVTSSPPSVAPEHSVDEIAMIRDLELLEEYEVVEKLDEVETFELLAAVNAETFDRLIDEEL